MNAADLEFDREKVLSWWTGRISNADLAAWTGQTERDVRLILSTGYFKEQIIGGGRGGSKTRRITAQARNAVAIIGAMRRAGQTIGASSSIIDAMPVLASFPTEVVDFSPGTLEAMAYYGGVVMLAHDDPDGGWALTDTVPNHVFDRKCWPIVRDGSSEIVNPRDVSWFPDYIKELGGKFPDGWHPVNDPLYRPEVDPAGIYEFGNDAPDTSDRLDHHFYIVNGRWVFIRYSDPAPREYMVSTFQRLECFKEREEEFRAAPKFDYEPVLEIRPNEVVLMRGDGDQKNEAFRAWERPETTLDVNTTYAVRRMKRRALGLVKE